MLKHKFGIRVFSDSEWVWFEEQTLENYYDSGVNIKTFNTLEEAREFAESHPELSLSLEQLDYFRIPTNFEEEEFLMSIIEYDEDTDEHYIFLPNDVVAHLNAKPGDNLSWEVTKDGMVRICKN